MKPEEYEEIRKLAAEEAGKFLERIKRLGVVRPSSWDDDVAAHERIDQLMTHSLDGLKKQKVNRPFSPFMVAVSEAADEGSDADKLVAARVMESHLIYVVCGGLAKKLKDDKFFRGWSPMKQHEEQLGIEHAYTDEDKLNRLKARLKERKLMK